MVLRPEALRERLLKLEEVISKLHDQNTMLAQRLALLEQRLRENA